MERAGLALPQERHDELREEEVAEVVGAELHVEALLRLPLGAEHDPGVVDEDVELVLVDEQLARALAHRLEGGEVEGEGVHVAAGFLVDEGGRGLGLLGVAAEEDYAGAAPADLQGRLVADAGVGTCNKQHEHDNSRTVRKSSVPAKLRKLDV